MYIVSTEYPPPSQALSSWVWSWVALGQCGEVLACRVGQGGGQQGVACRVEATWRVGSSGVACHIGVAVAVSRAISGRHAGAGMSGDDSHAQGGSNGPAMFRLWYCEPCQGGVLGWGRVKMTRVLEGTAMGLQLSGHGIASHVRAACWGGDEWRWLRWLTCTRGRQWPATLKLWGWSMWNNGVVCGSITVRVVGEKRVNDTHSHATD
ncbi:hypothetical protein EDB89DRAFT_1911229 [Lactarius sanguifluus]|nr:hypothetical protein EDB89DRAFT_1911229 [Lactarius sanguifluus]